MRFNSDVTKEFKKDVYSFSLRLFVHSKNQDKTYSTRVSIFFIMIQELVY